MNKLILLGRLTRDMELRTTSGGTLIGKGGIAVDSYAGKDKDGEAKQRTLFLDFVTFEKLAENMAKHFRKGSPVLLEGELTYQTWEKDGQKRSKHEMKVERFEFLPRNAKTDGDDGAGDESTTVNARNAKGGGSKTVDDYEDIPF